MKRVSDEGRSDLAVWREDAEKAGYRHRSVLRLDEIKPALTNEQRIELAREAAMPLLSEAFQKRAVLSGDEVREIAARGLVVAGLGDRPADDIAAVTRTFRERGVTIAGERTHLVWGMEPGEGGKPRIVVTTGHTIDQERELVALVREAAADKSAALTPGQVDRAADRFLARNPQVDPNGVQWQAQREMAHRIGEGGRFSLSIGVAGSGKTSSVAATLVDAWHAEGRTVYGMTVPWKASDALRAAGVDHAVAIEAFIRRAEAGQYTLDSNSVILADEVSMIGVRQQLALARLARETGAQLVEIGDPRQCQAVETPAIDLLAKAIGDEAIPKLLTSIRQQTARGREVAAMFRDGRAVEAVAAMREDDQVHLVAGGPAPVIQRTTELWRKLTDANAANPDYTLLVMTPTNTQAREVGMAIRANRRAAGEIAPEDGAVLKAMDPNSQETFDLPVAVGDKLRMFTRTFDAEAKGARKFLSSNGDVVEVLELQPDGIRVRNAGGDEGLVTWAQMKPWRAPRNDPVRVTYGYAVTVDTAQSATTTAAILAMPEGSRQVTGYKAYTAGSRPQVEYHMVVSDAAERRDIVRPADDRCAARTAARGGCASQPRGEPRPVRREAECDGLADRCRRRRARHDRQLSARHGTARAPAAGLGPAAHDLRDAAAGAGDGAGRGGDAAGPGEGRHPLGTDHGDRPGTDPPAASGGGAGAGARGRARVPRAVHGPVDALPAAVLQQGDHLGQLGRVLGAEGHQLAQRHVERVLVRRGRPGHRGQNFRQYFALHRLQPQHAVHRLGLRVHRRLQAFQRRRLLRGE